MEMAGNEMLLENRENLWLKTWIIANLKKDNYTAQLT
jgi:hypothetical protein